jgi:hypothetical protein
MAGPLTYNVGDLLSQAFGVGGFFVDGQQAPVLIDAKSYKGIIYKKRPEAPKSSLGTTILCQVTLGKGQINWQTIEDGKVVPNTCEAMVLPATTLVDFSQAKIIERTMVPGRKGSVKEYIGLDDWRIRIRGILINFNAEDELPEDEIRALKNLKNVPVSIPIINDVAEWLGISDLVIENIEFTAIEGFGNMQPFTIDCLSDDAFELKYKNGL